MNLIELFVPKGSVSEERRRRLSERLTTELIDAPGAPVELIARGREISWLVVHEPEVWSVGGRPLHPSDPPRFVVRVSVPGGHLNDGMRTEMVERITRVLAESDDAPERLYEEPHALVQIVEIRDGNTGAFGQTLMTSDITRMVISGDKPARATHDHRGTPATAIDPVCGMTVEVDGDALTLERDGVTYAFCGTPCRHIFATSEPTRAQEPDRLLTD